MEPNAIGHFFFFFDPAFKNCNVHDGSLKIKIKNKTKKKTAEVRQQGKTFMN